jgi:hypothetical protein
LRILGPNFFLKAAKPGFVTKLFDLIEELLCGDVMLLGLLLVLACPIQIRGDLLAEIADPLRAILFDMVCCPFGGEEGLIVGLVLALYVARKYRYIVHRFCPFLLTERPAPTVSRQAPAPGLAVLDEPPGAERQKRRAGPRVTQQA